MLLCKAYHLARLYFLFYLARIANGAFHVLRRSPLWSYPPFVNNRRCGFCFVCVWACCFLCSCRNVFPLDSCPLPWLLLQNAGSWLLSFPSPADLNGSIHCVFEALPLFIWIKHLPILSKLYIRIKKKMTQSGFSCIYSPCNNINISRKLLRKITKSWFHKQSQTALAISPFIYPKVGTYPV